MKRRRLMETLSVFTLSGCIGVTSDESEEGSTSGKEFGFESPGFDRIEWVNLDVLSIYFESDHDMDGFGIFHSHDNFEHLDDAFVLCEPPRFEGPINFPLIDRISGSSVVYPNREFALVAYDGTFSECDTSVSVTFAQDIEGSVTFTIPSSIAPRPNFKDLETFTRTTLPVHTGE